MLGAACKPSRLAAAGHRRSPRPGRLRSQLPRATAGPTGRSSGSRSELRRAPMADDWVLLGQAWIQKARHAGDPGLYPRGRRGGDAGAGDGAGAPGALGLRAPGATQPACASPRHAARQSAPLAWSPDRDVLALATPLRRGAGAGRPPALSRPAQRRSTSKPGLASYGACAPTSAGSPATSLAPSPALPGRHRGRPCGAAGRDAGAGGDGVLERGRPRRGDRPGRAERWPPLLATRRRWSSEARVRLARGGSVRRLPFRSSSAPTPRSRWWRRRGSSPTHASVAGDARGAAAAGGTRAPATRTSERSAGCWGRFSPRGAGICPRRFVCWRPSYRARPGLAVEDAYAWALHRAGRRLGKAGRERSGAGPRHAGSGGSRSTPGRSASRPGDREGGTALVRRALALNPALRSARCHGSPSDAPRRAFRRQRFPHGARARKVLPWRPGGALPGHRGSLDGGPRRR